MAGRATVDVFGFRDYRAFLATYVARMRAQKEGFSPSEFAKQAGLRSSNYLNLVIADHRNLTPDLACRFAAACQLHDEAVKYFCALVAFNQSKTARERSIHYEALQRFPRFRASHRLEGAQSAYHSQWYIPAIYELCGCADFEEAPQKIAKRLLPAITAKQAQNGVTARAG
jgi:uncharacterized protein (TIGR02147 family)